MLCDDGAMDGGWPEYVDDRSRSGFDVQSSVLRRLSADFSWLVVDCGRAATGPRSRIVPVERQVDRSVYWFTVVMSTW